MSAIEPIIVRPKIAKDRCDEIVARTPQVVKETTLAPRDWTHLQFCGAPAVKNHKCARHIKQPVRGLRGSWHRFLGTKNRKVAG